MPAKVTVSECIGCGACVDACPADAITMQDGIAVISVDACVDCGACVDECPNNAISME